MPMNDPEPEIDVHKRLDELGEAQVRLLMSTGGLPTQWHVSIYDWLSKKEKEQKAIVAKQSHITTTIDEKHTTTTTE